MAFSAPTLGLLSALSIVSCRDLSAAATKMPSQDAAVGRLASQADHTDWKGQAISAALAGVERHMTVKATLAAMEGKVVEVGEERWWKAALKSGSTVVLSAGEKDREVRTIDIYFQLSDGLRLRELVPILGEYTKVFESKTAGVRFDHVSAPGLVAFADLFSSKILPGSEVVKVSIVRPP